MAPKRSLNTGESEVNIVYTQVKSKRGLRKYCESYVTDQKHGLVRLPAQLLSVDSKNSEFETVATPQCTELRLRKIAKVVTRKVALLIGFSEVPNAEERCTRLERFFLEEMNFAKRDVHMYSDLSRKNINRVLDDLAPVLHNKTP